MLVLNDPAAQDPGTVVAEPQPVAEARHGIVEGDEVGLAVEPERGDGFGVELQWSPLGGSLGEASDRFPAAAAGIDVEQTMPETRRRALPGRSWPGRKASTSVAVR